MQSDSAQLVQSSVIQFWWSRGHISGHALEDPSAGTRRNAGGMQLVLPSLAEGD